LERRDGFLKIQTRRETRNNYANTFIISLAYHSRIKKWGGIVVAETKKTEELEQFLDHEFRNKEIIEEARRRRAYSNEHPDKTIGCMDPLATLGDAVLDTIVVMKLYEDGERSKGKITEKKIEKVRHKQTRAFAKNHDLKDYVLWGKGEYKQMDSVSRGKAFDAVTEALIGALFLDTQQDGRNGLLAVQQFLDVKGFFLKN
jgi:ribonuclease III